MLRIALFIRGDLPWPICLVRLHFTSAIDARRAAVPKTPMDEHASALVSKNQIGFAGKVRTMESISKTLPV